MTRDGGYTAMKISTFARHWREGFKNLGRHGWMTFASVSAVSVTLLLLGTFLVLAYNVQQFSLQIEQQVEMNVTVKKGSNRADVLDLERQIKAMPGVKEVTFISKEQGLEQMKEKFKDQADLLAGYEQDNPLPDKFVVRAEDPQKTSAVADKVKSLPLVDEVNYAKETVERLFSITEIVRNVGAAFVIGLSFTALFLIHNTIKVTIFARRREIEIMKLVGATNGFIRWPFLIEGLLIGVLGTLAPLIFIGIGYDYLVRHVGGVMYFYFAPFDPLIYSVAGILLGIGALIGMIGSVMSIGRFLRV